MAQRQRTSTQILMKETVLPEEMKMATQFSEESDFFEFFSASQVLKNYDLSDEEVMSGLLDDSHDGGCDAFYVFCNDTFIHLEEQETYVFPRIIKFDVYIFQSKSVFGFDENVILKFKTLSANLLDIGADFAAYVNRYTEDVISAFKGFVQLYKRSVARQVELHFHFVYASLGAQVSENVHAQGEELKTVVKRCYPNANVDVCFVGAEDLFLMYQQPKNNTKNLSLAAAPIGMGKKNDYVALVYLKDYYRFITQDDERICSSLFEANVRDYQGNNSVNKSIGETLCSTNNEDNFWWLNNGVTILAQKVIPVSSVELQLFDPKIVNGMQTSTEIHLFFKKHKERLEEETRSVLVRVIVPQSEESRDNIIYATNNQTPVSSSSLRVTAPVHYKIETYFKSRGLYYDRRKNYYKNQGRRASEIVSIGFLGQCMISMFLRRPDHARARPSTVLASDDMYNSLYNEQTPLEAYFRCAQIGKIVNEHVWKSDDLTKNEKTNLLFYVIYAVAARLLAKEKLYPQDIVAVDIAQITRTFLDEVVLLVKTVFAQNGGTDKVAKGPNFIGELIKAMASTWGVHLYKATPSAGEIVGATNSPNGGA